MEETQKTIQTGRGPKPYLGNPTNTIAVLNEYHFSMQKRYGQNFLIDERVLEKIVDRAEITPEDEILEIGPGIGTLTQYLAYYAHHVTAVEIDSTLMPVLEDTLSGYHNVDVVNEDILKYDLESLCEAAKAEGRPLKVVANLPYYITTPIIMELLERRLPVQSITVMIQKEVADRMQAGPGSKDYGALSLAVQYYADPQVVANVPPNCFMPRPNVGSAVIRLARCETPPVKVEDERLMFRVIRAAFNQRRKTMQNALGNAGIAEKEKTAAILDCMGLSQTIRGEALTLGQFAEFTNHLIG